MQSCTDVNNNKLLLLLFSSHATCWRQHSQCLKCGWTVMDGVQTLLFKCGRHPATSWTNALWMASTQRPGAKWEVFYSTFSYL